MPIVKRIKSAPEYFNQVEKIKKSADKTRELKKKAKETFNKATTDHGYQSAKSSAKKMSDAMSKISNSQRNEWVKEKRKREYDAAAAEGAARSKKHKQEVDLRISNYEAGKSEGHQSSDDKWRKRLDTLKKIQRNNSGISGWARKIKGIFKK